jgi:malate permease and related proteins
MTQRLFLFFALIALGFLLRRRNTIGTAGIKDLIRLIIDVLMPALTFTSTALLLTPQTAGLDRGIAGPLLGMPLLAFAICLAGAGLGWLLLPMAGLKGERGLTFIFLIGFANSSFLPIPLSYAVSGELGVLYVMLYLAGWMLLFWTLGMYMIRGKPEYKFLLHPQMLAMYLGTALGLSGTHVPDILTEVLKMIGASGIPLALLCVGAVMAEQGVDLRKDWRPVSVMVAGKMLILPGLVLALVKWGGLGAPLGPHAVLQAAMPCMAQAALYVVRFGGDIRLAGAASFATTLVAALTVPFFMGLIG